MSSIRPLVLIPAYSHLDWRLADVLKRTGVPYMHVHGCSDLPRARSRLLDDALATKANVFILVDADMTPTPEHFGQMVESPLLDADNAVSGCYLVQPGRLAAVIPEEEEIEIGGEKRFVKILLAGCGFAAIHRDTVVRLKEALPAVRDPTGGEWCPYFLPFVLEQSLPDETVVRQYIPEDYSFWYRLHTVAKATLWLDTHVAVGHVKQNVLLPQGKVRTLGDSVDKSE